jgi:glycolate oxidase FAD binding subunit
MRVVNTTGLISKSGGKVVKNVSGYDLNKLYIGSLGTVGLIGEVTFKVQPMARASATVTARFDDVTSAAYASDRLARSPLFPSALAMISPAASAAIERSADHPVGGGYVLVMMSSGFEKPVARSIADARRIVADAGARDIDDLSEAMSARLWHAIREFAGRPVAEDAASAFAKISVPISQIAPMLDACERVSRCQAATLAQTGTGVIYAWLAGPDDETLVSALRGLRAFARECEGSLVIEQGSAALKSQIDVWGDVGSSFGIMRRIKDNLDPAGILNPGRFVGGI